MTMPAWWRDLSRRMTRAIAGPADIADGQLLVAGLAGDPALRRHIAVGPMRSQEERLAVYQRQYWMRLIDVLQAELPSALAVVGVEPFNRLALRYLADLPPQEAELHRLALRFPRWLRGKPGVPPGLERAARWDVQRADLFAASPLPPGSGIPLVPWRFWRGPPPAAIGRADAVLVRWRHANGAVLHQPIGRAAMRFLDLLRRTRDLDAACAALALTSPTAARDLADWYGRFSAWGWFAAEAGRQTQPGSRAEQTPEPLPAAGPRSSPSGPPAIHTPCSG